MRFTSHNSNPAKVDQQVRVLDAARLKSELAAYIWSQTEDWRSSRNSGKDAPGAAAEFGDQKKALTNEVLKFAGQKIAQSDLITNLKKIISQGRNEAIQRLDAKTMASKISVRA